MCCDGLVSMGLKFCVGVGEGSVCPPADVDCEGVVSTCFFRGGF